MTTNLKKKKNTAIRALSESEFLKKTQQKETQSLTVFAIVVPNENLTTYI